MSKQKPDNSFRPSLLVSILRRQANKTPEYNQRQWRWWYQLKQKFLILLLMVGAVYLVFWLQTSKPTKANSESIAESKVEMDATAVLEHKEELSTRDLIYLASQMDLDPNAALPIQMQWITDRTNIANQLLSKPDDELAQKEGTLYRMETLQLHSNLNRKYKMGKDTLDAQLYDLCSANLNHSDQEVSKIAAVVVMMSALHQFSNDPNQVNLKDALSKCKQITSQLSDDHEIAFAIFKYAKLMKRSDVMVDDAVEFFKVIVDQYEASSNDKASSVARKAFREILFGDESGDPKFSMLLTAGIKDRFRQNRKSVDGELANRILYSLNENQLEESGTKQIIALLEIMLAKDKFDLAAKVSDQVREYFSGREGFAYAAQEVLQFKQRLAAYQSKFDLNGANRIGGENDELGIAPTLVVFWSPHEGMSTRLLSSLNSLSVGRVMQTVIVCRGLSDDDIKQVEKLAKEMPSFVFVHVDSGTKDGTQVDFQIPVPSLPYLLLLDSEHKVIGINLDVRDLGKKIQTLLN